jgi:hypothetical protein
MNGPRQWNRTKGGKLRTSWLPCIWHKVGEITGQPIDSYTTEGLEIQIDLTAQRLTDQNKLNITNKTDELRTSWLPCISHIHIRSGKLQVLYRGFLFIKYDPYHLPQRQGILGTEKLISTADRRFILRNERYLTEQHYIRNGLREILQFHERRRRARGGSASPPCDRSREIESRRRKGILGFSPTRLGNELGCW